MLPEPDPPSPEELPELPEPSGDRERARETFALWLEVAAVLLIAVVPDLWSSLTFLIWPAASPWPAAGHYTGLILRSFQVSALVLYLIWRSGTPWAQFGLAAPRGMSNALWFVDAVIAGYFAYAFYAGGVAAVISDEALHRELKRIHGIFPSAATPGEILLGGISCIANGFAEELAMRGYLIPRFERLLGSSLKAVLLSSVLFASYHLYQGVYGAGSALVIGLLYGTLFCWSRRLWPLAAAHAFHGLESLL
jgi:membrane protease YdiL (CAAX protease family)